MCQDSDDDSVIARLSTKVITDEELRTLVERFKSNPHDVWRAPQDYQQRNDRDQQITSGHREKLGRVPRGDRIISARLAKMPKKQR